MVNWLPLIVYFSVSKKLDVDVMVVCVITKVSQVAEKDVGSHGYVPLTSGLSHSVEALELNAHVPIKGETIKGETLSSLSLHVEKMTAKTKRVAKNFSWFFILMCLRIT